MNSKEDYEYFNQKDVFKIICISSCEESKHKKEMIQETIRALIKEKKF